MIRQEITRKFVSVGKAPAHVQELLGDIEVTIPIARAFHAIEKVHLEAQRNIATLENKDEVVPVVLAVSHLLSHFRLFRDQGNHDIKYLETRKQQ